MRLFTTDDYRPTERFDAFTEEFARRVMLLDNIWQQDDQSYHGEIDLRLIGPLVCTRMASTPVGFERKRPANGDGAVVLGIHRRGRFHLAHRDLSWDSLEDYASLMTDNDTSVGRFDGEALAIRIPRVMLSAHLPSGEMPSPARIRRDTPLAALMESYLAAYLRLPAGVAPEVGETVGRHLVELAALALGATGDAKDAIRESGLRASRRQAALDEIAKGFAMPGLAPDAVARAVGISERYLRQLFEESGTSFTDLVLEHRLDRARQMLADPTQRHIRITDIAYDAGFSDLSYFNRAFRRRYGGTPSDVRADALRRA